MEQSLGNRKHEGAVALARARQLGLGPRALAAAAPGGREGLATLQAFARAAASHCASALLVGGALPLRLAEGLAAALGPQPDGLPLRGASADVGDEELAHALLVLLDPAGPAEEALAAALLARLRALAEAGTIAPGSLASRVVAVVREGSPLARLAQEVGARTFPAGGGPFVAFAPEGLLPAALLGHDLAAWLDAAARAFDSGTSEEGEALLLGVALAGLSAAGADKLTLSLGPPLEPLGRWIAALAVQALSRGGQGVVPVLGEPVGEARDYGPDRLFVGVRLEESAPAAAPAAKSDDQRLRRLISNGLPVLRWTLPGLAALPGELARWQAACLAAALLLAVDPQDDADGEALHARTRDRLAAPAPQEPVLRGAGLQLAAPPTLAHMLPRIAGTLGGDAAQSLVHWVAAHLALAEQGEFVALLVHAPGAPALDEALRAVRGALRAATRLPVLVLRADAPAALLLSGRGAGLFLLLAAPAGPAGEAAAQAAYELLCERERRVVQLRSDANDPLALVDAVREAAALIAK